MLGCPLDVCIHFRFRNMSGDQTKPETRRYSPCLGLSNTPSTTGKPTNGNNKTTNAIMVPRAAA
jgi:hypothetical protein